MTAKHQLGLGFQSNKSAADYARLAQRAEGAGFDVLTVFNDLMFQPALYPLLVMALHTERVRLGPACLNPYATPPFELAGQIAALDNASDGRAYLGLSRGTWLDAVGVPQPRPLQTLREAAAVVRHLLQGDNGPFEGEIFTLAAGTTLRYEVRRPNPPLLVGTWGRRTAALAGEIADEIKVGGCANPAMVPVVREYLQEGADAAGRTVDDVGVVLGAVTVVDEDRAVARSLARTEVAMYLAVVAQLDPTVEVPPDLLSRIQIHLQRGEDEAAGRLVPDDLLDRFAFAGTPDDVANHAATLFDAGVRRVEFGTPHGITDDRGVGLLGDRVLPLLR